MSNQRISILYADPPWPWATYSSKSGDKTGRGCQRMTWEQLVRLGDLLQPHLDPRAYLLLWMPRSQILPALDMAHSWGFERVLLGPAWIWLKQHPSGKFAVGTGYVTRLQSESVWLFGRCPEQDRPLRLQSHKARRIMQGLQYWGPKSSGPPAPPELVFAPPSGRGNLWAKPPTVRRLIERRWPGDLRRVELFARPHPDLDTSIWECYGNEVDGQDIWDALRAGLGERDE